MSNFSLARKNMVNNQIKSLGLKNNKILKAMEEIPREIFVADKDKELAYLDEDFSYGDGRYLIEPSIFAKMLDLADL
jgi:protein-L-isoaspartate(D-aspartate) O-methyltransferase